MSPGTAPATRIGPKRRRMRLAAAAVGAGVALVFAELGLRAYFPLQMQPPIWRPSDTQSFELQPGAVGRHRTRAFDVTYRISAQGYRSPPFAVAKPPGARRILTVGDSFTFGHGVREGEEYSAVLRREMASGAEVINGGYASGMAPDDAAVYLRRAVPVLAPDVVVHGLCAWNDIGDVYEHAQGPPDAHGIPAWTRSTENAINALGTRGALPWFYRVPGLRSSYVWLLAGKASLRLFGSRRVVAARELNLSLHQEGFSRPEYAEAFQRTMGYLAAIDAWCAEHDAAYLVALIPFVSQVTPDAFNADFYTRVPPDKRDLREPQRKIRRALDERGVAVLDLRQAIAPLGKDAYFMGDDHWNAAGHAAAGRAMAAELRRRWPDRVGPAPARAAEAPARQEP